MIGSVDAVASRRLDGFADHVGLDRQLTPAAVYQHREPDAGRAAEVGQLIQRRANGPPGVEHVVHDHHAFPRQLAGNVRFTDQGLGAHGGEVVTIQGDVEGAAGNLGAGARGDELGDPVSELDAAPLNADQHQVPGAVFAGQLRDGGSHMFERPRDGAGVEYGAALARRCHYQRAT